MQRVALLGGKHNVLAARRIFCLCVQVYGHYSEGNQSCKHLQPNYYYGPLGIHGHQAYRKLGDRNASELRQ